MIFCGNEACHYQATGGVSARATRPMTARAVTVVGGGLAGCEAAWQLARRGVGVDLVRDAAACARRPCTRPADLAELVCSNSLRGNALDQAAGLLKEEMRRLDSLVVRVADEVRVPGRAARSPSTAACSPGASPRP